MNLTQIRNKLLKNRPLLRPSPKRDRAFMVLIWISMILVLIDFLLTKIGQMDVAVLFYTLVTIPIALSFLLFVPKKVLVRYDKRARPKFKKLAAGIIPLMCLDIGSLIVFLYFIGGGISFGLNVGVELVPFVIISGPILEELIFRLGIIGVMGGGIGWLAKRSGARWHEGKIFKFLLIAVSAITFGLAHMFDIIKRTPQMIALITIGGAIYGYAYTRYGLGSSILMHAIYNVFAFML